MFSQGQTWFSSVEEAFSYINDTERQYNVKFTTKRTRKMDLFRKQVKVFWKDDGTPYIIVQNTLLQLSVSEASENFSQDLDKATLTLVEAKCFYDFKVTDTSRKSMRAVASKQLKDALLQNLSIKQSHECFVRFDRLNVTKKESFQAENEESIQAENNLAVKWTSSFDEAMQVLQEHEVATKMKFIYKYRYKPKLDNHHRRVRILWNSGIPCIPVKNIYLECHLGKDRNAAKNRSRNVNTIPSHLMDHHHKPARLVVQSTKKMGCNAVAQIVEMARYPQFQVAKHDLKDIAKAETSLRLALAGTDNRESIPKEIAYRITLPSMQDHTGHHGTNDVCGIQQVIDKRLVSRIYDMVNSGIRNLQEIRRSLSMFVTEVLFKDKEPPEKSNRRFYPTQKDIRNHYNLAFSKRKLAKLDQENVSCLVEKWLESSNLGDKMLFRPYVAGAEDVIDTADENVPRLNSNQCLLFVHQMAWQRRLLLRYGQDICLLDATYKTSKYALPLFFVCVKTNVGYQVVATFVVQNEATSDIQEALNILKCWNPDWKPQFFMTDKCEAEINAIEDCFQDCHVLICDFHREQAWERWMKRSENSMGESREEALDLMRAVAKAATDEAFEVALNRLQDSDVYQKNPQFQKYFGNTWLSEKERWVCLYRIDKLKVLVRTNNGVERQNRILKERHIHGRSDRSLSGLLTVIHEEFLPEAWQRYKQHNLLASASYKRYNENIPLFLHNRPTEVVKHLMHRIRSSSNVDPADISRKGNLFSVKSASTTEVYVVSFGDCNIFPKCSCCDFKKYFLPCKHMFAIFHKFSDVSWANLPEWYRESPIMILDREIVGNKSESLPLLQSIDEPTHEAAAAREKDIVGSDVYSNNISTANPPVDASMLSQGTNTVDAEKVENKRKKSLNRICDLLGEIKSLSYDAASQESLDMVATKLQEIINGVQESCRYDAGLRLTFDKEVSKKKLNSKSKRSATFRFGELPRKFPKRNPFSTRVGHTASVMKPLHAVTGLRPVSRNAVDDKKAEFLLRRKKTLVVKRFQSKASSSFSQSASFTPNAAAVKGFSLNKCILKNGPHSVSLLQLKSLEPSLSRSELALLRIHDKQFQCGWLYDEIINSYLWCLCKQHPNCIYASSVIGQVLQKGCSIEKLWDGIDLFGKKWLFLPWNPSGLHWILIVVDLVKRKMLYFDPKQNSFEKSNFFVHLATGMINSLLREKFGFSITGVELRKKFLQNDNSSCGVYVCWYAKVIAEEKDLSVQDRLVLDFRKEIFYTLAGGCLKGIKKSNATCFFCNHLASQDFITCQRCNRKLHLKCMGIANEQGLDDRIFVCPFGKNE